MNDILQQLMGAAHDTNRFVRSNPWRAVGTMALAGLAAGILASKGVQWRQRRSAAERNSGADFDVVGG